MNKLLCIVGPTATGKTARALKEAIKTPSIIVSADSRQVYRGMDIVTGKDHLQGTTIYGIDILEPDQPCSVSVWYNAVIPHIKAAWEEGKQVIVVGGTGLYVRAVSEGIETMPIPLNQPLRDSLSLLSLKQLQDKLVSLDSQKFASMNHSDQHNPRRLIRAIEVCLNRSSTKQTKNLNNLETEIIGLRCIDDLAQRDRIIARVRQRLQLGAVQETKVLVDKYGQSLQSLSAIGYRSLILYLEGKLNESEMFNSWVADELSYAKRQLTWFKKVKSIQWYN